MTVAEDIVKAVEHVPPLSQSASALMGTVADQSHSLDDIVRVVETDGVLTAALLKVVNSAAFGLRQPITSANRAVALLGDKMTTGIAIGICASKVYNNALEGYDGEEGQLWHHSLHTAIGAREVSKHTNNLVSQEDAYSAGIMHDIGKGILSEFMKGSTRELVAAADADDAHDFRAAEHKRYQTDHCLVGSELARHWKLPSPLVDAISWHHEPAKSPQEHRALVYVTHVADFMSMMSGIGTGADSMLYPFDGDYTKYIQLDRKKLESIMFRVTLEYEKTAGALLGRNVGGQDA